MGQNILPFAVRRTTPAPVRNPAARLLVTAKSATLAIMIAPRKPA